MTKQEYINFITNAKKADGSECELNEVPDNIECQETDGTWYKYDLRLDYLPTFEYVVFRIKEPDKPVLEASGQFFRSILVLCPHCGDQNEYDFTDQDVLLNTKQMCSHCDNFYLITNIESEYL